MIFRNWARGIAISPPVYLDANVLVGFTINQHPLYQNCSTILADLLAGTYPILLSDVSFSEAQWAITRVSFCHLVNQPANANFTKQTYMRRYAQIFQTYGTRLSAISSLVKGLTQNGFPIDVVPSSVSQWIQVMDLSQGYMQRYGLTPADAIHLGLAEIYAKTFITADGDFSRRMISASSGSGLVVLSVPP